jgi:poly [ADP-ribose] polymerase 2/3/4
MLLQMRRDAETVAESGPEADAFWTDASSKWFTLFPTTRPYTMRGFEQIADNVCHCYALLYLMFRAVWSDLLG